MINDVVAEEKGKRTLYDIHHTEPVCHCPALMEILTQTILSERKGKELYLRV